MRIRLALALAVALAAGASVTPLRAEPGSWADAPEKLPRLPRGDRIKNLEFLFEALKAAPDADSAKLVEGRMWALWLASGSDTTDLLMSRVKSAMDNKDNALAIKLLDAGNIAWLEPMWQFDLEATPALCRAYDAALRRLVTSDEFDWTVSERVEGQLPNIKFLVAAHCDLDAGLAGAEPRVRKVLAGNNGDARWQRLLDTLGGLRQRR